MNNISIDSSVSKIINDYSPKGYIFNDHGKVKIYGHLVSPKVLPVVDVLLNAKRLYDSEHKSADAVIASFYLIQLQNEDVKDDIGSAFKLINHNALGIERVYYQNQSDANLLSLEIMSVANQYYPDINMVIVENISGAFTEVFGKTVGRYLNELKFRK